MEFLNSMSWPGAFVIVGSIVTIVTGIFGYLISTHKKAQDSTTLDLQTISEMEKLHSRVSEIKDRVAADAGDIKELRSYVKSIQRQITDHEHRDIEDFKVIQLKLDKLMEIIIQILQDDSI